VIPSTPEPVWGSPLPESFQNARLEEGKLLPTSGSAPLLLTWAPGLYLAQAADALAALDEAKVNVWWRSPQGSVAYPLQLMDAAAFQKWLDLPKPGRLRIIQREDGLELQTSIGKLPGPDANGPSLPQLEGRVDVAGLRRALAQLHQRFGAIEGVALVPAFGMELDTIAEALSGMYRAPGEPYFEPLLLVYPRPGAPTPGKGPTKVAPSPH
jgi:hypothetical protein